MKKRGVLPIVVGSMMLTAFVSLIALGPGNDLGVDVIGISVATIGVGLLVLGLLRWLESP